MNLILSFLLPLPHLMNSSPATLTSTLIIIQTTLPLSFSLLSSFNLTPHVNFPTQNQNHILDLVITSSDSSLAQSLFVTHCSPSDHFPIFTKLSVERTPLPPPTFHSFRRLHSIDKNSFLFDLQCSRLAYNQSSKVQIHFALS